MLLPNKYMDYNVSIINIAASILQILLELQVCSYNEVLNSIKNKHGEDSKFELQNAINFLYLLGLIEYYQNKDVLGLII